MNSISLFADNKERISLRFNNKISFLSSKLSSFVF